MHPELATLWRQLGATLGRGRYIRARKEINARIRRGDLAVPAEVHDGAMPLRVERAPEGGGLYAVDLEHPEGPTAVANGDSLLLSRRTTPTGRRKIIDGKPRPFSVYLSPEEARLVKRAAEETNHRYISEYVREVTVAHAALVLGRGVR